MSQVQKYDAAGRLFAIVAALILAGNHGLTKGDLYRVVEAYAEQLANDDDTVALDRKFDRDKAELRENGFNLQTRTIDDDVRYFIPQSNFAFPDFTELSPRQVQLLNLASEIWTQGALSSDAGRAAIRLRGLGLSTSTDSLLEVAPRIQVHEPSFIALTDAVAEVMQVEFDYRKPGSTSIERRRVTPWAFTNVESQWLMQCWDHHREAPRNFLLKRIVSKVKVVKDSETGSALAGRAATGNELATARADLGALIAGQIAEFAVHNGSEAWFHFVEGSTATTEWVNHSMNFMDVHLLAEELRAYGSDIRIASPVALLDAVAGGFNKVVKAHA